MFSRLPRGALGASSVALLLAACGASPAARTAAETLGVQSNRTTAPITLRLAPRGPMTFATELGMTLASEMLGQPMSADVDTRGVRRVVEVRPDGSLVIEEVDTASRYQITMMGNTESGPETPDAPGEPRRYVLDARGQQLETLPPPGPPPPGAGPPGAPPLAGRQGGAMRDVVQDRLQNALEPMVRALAFPERPVSIGDEWGADGRISFRDVDPSMEGEALYRLTQRLDRFEGTGDTRMAIVAFDGSLEGSGRSAGGQAPTDAGIAGRIQVRGFYAVALVDGFTRTARASFDGEVRLGPEQMMRFPLRGEIRWDAAPIPVQAQ